MRVRGWRGGRGREEGEGDEDSAGGGEAPNWTRDISAWRSMPWVARKAAAIGGEEREKWVRGWI